MSDLIRLLNWSTFLLFWRGLSAEKDFLLLFFRTCLLSSIFFCRDTIPFNALIRTFIGIIIQPKLNLTLLFI